MEELRLAEQACFACLGELASPLSAKYHTQGDDGEHVNPAPKGGSASKTISRLENDILHLYVFSWTAESLALQTTILDKFSAPTDAGSTLPPELSKFGPLERTEPRRETRLLSSAL